MKGIPKQVTLMIFFFVIVRIAPLIILIHIKFLIIFPVPHILLIQNKRTRRMLNIYLFIV